jgi:16S rRNA (cytosine967-C5)-methyltransferase
MRVVDVCSAPGGKAFACAVRMKNLGEIFAFELHQGKISIIEEGADRLGLDIIRAEARDALKPAVELFGTADRVICDVPCSGLGVMGKKPDLRYKDLSGIGDLPTLQYDILNQSVKYLKDGGILLYSTCTLNPKENVEVVEKFLKENPIYTYHEAKIGNLSIGQGGLTLTPHRHGTDGFYICLIRKKYD